jgi:hypothetical protein
MDPTRAPDRLQPGGTQGEDWCSPPKHRDGKLSAMNLLLGLVIGVLLTIGTTFIADAFTAGEVTETCSKQIVNWDVAKERLHDSTASIQTGWDRLKNGLRSLE